MKKLLMISMVAMLAITVACGDDDDNTTPVPPTPGKLSVSVAAAPASIAIDAKTTVTITASEAVKSDLAVTIAVDKADVLTVPTTATIKKGATTATVEGTGKAAGDATITISCAGATVTTATAKVTVKGDEKPVDKITLTATATTLNFSSADAAVSAAVTLTLSKAVDHAIEVSCNYNFDKWGWVNNLEGYPQGVTWSEYPVVIPANSTTHSFSLEIEQGNAGTLPLVVESIDDAAIEFTTAEFDFVITK
ncbi:MAG: hypothetical protein RSB85_06925 [Rikenellaceae bacterium]